MAAAPGKQLLDQRVPSSARFQIKGTTSSAPRARIALSVADRLAKDAGPTFVVVFGVDREGEVHSVRLIHLIGPVLAQILRRLREAQAAGRQDLHKLWVTFDVSTVGVPFALTREGLLAALADAMGPDPTAYATAKRSQLDNLGYETGGLIAEITFDITEQGDLQDILLGLTELAAKQITAFDERFGIRIPIDSLSAPEGQKCLLDVEPTETCTVTVRGQGVQPPAIFPGEVRQLSQLGTVSAKDDFFLITTESFRLSMATGNVGFRTNSAAFAEVRPLAAWIRLFRVMAYLAAPGASITVAPASIPEPHVMPVPVLLDAPILKQTPNLVRILEHAQRLFALAGLDEGPGYRLAELVRESGALRLAGDLLFGDVAKLPFSLVAVAGPGPAAVDALIVDQVALDNATIAYAATLTFQLDAEAGLFRPHAAEAKDVRVIGPGAFKAYEAGQRDAALGQAIIHVRHTDDEL